MVMSGIYDIISRNVIKASPFDTIKSICDTIKEKSVGAVVIINSDDEVVGIITERDIIKKVICDKKDSETLVAKDIMTTKVIIGTEDLSIVKAANIFMENKIKKLPIVKNGKLIGIITQTDLMRFLTPKF